MASPYRTVVLVLQSVRDYASLFAAFIGVLYAAGFMIVNSYLGGYGVRETEAISTRYIGAGLVFVAFAALAFVVVDNVRIVRSHVTGPVRVALIALAIVIGPLGVAAAEILVLWRALAGPLGERDLASVVDAPLVLTIVVMNFAITVSTLLLQTLVQLPLPVGPARFARGASSGFLILVFVGVVLLWAAYVYPRLPGYLGGGEPSRVRLVMSQAIADACRACVDTDVLLVEQEGNRLVVLIDDGTGRKIAVELYLLPNGDRAIIHRR